MGGTQTLQRRHPASRAVRLRRRVQLRADRRVPRARTGGPWRSTGRRAGPCTGCTGRFPRTRRSRGASRRCATARSRLGAAECRDARQRESSEGAETSVVLDRQRRRPDHRRRTRRWTCSRSTGSTPPSRRALAGTPGSTGATTWTSSCRSCSSEVPASAAYRLTSICRRTSPRQGASAAARSS